jgi:hypothetical protein
MHNKKSGTRNSAACPTQSSSLSSLPPVSALHRRTYEPTISPNQTRKPASQSQAFHLIKCNGTQVQGRNQAALRQSRPGAGERGQYNRAMIPCKPNTNKPLPGLVLLLLLLHLIGGGPLCHYLILPTHNLEKRVAQARGRCWGS